ncbi:fucose permease [Longilinea arvoryzae]|uniref:Fucose permease n=1 Tax=Longilinea arvoryzae TaxID=360412 RepID=A0A0S7BJ11_9CHLR|nr:MFS transporter [Longilinea arvoryzae]GAP15609.1 fucose permease [Longilinea arvoryzae]
MKNTQSIGILSLACASFFGLGVITAAVGPSLPNLAGNTASTLSAVGSLFTALFFGALAAQSFTGLLLDRLGPRWLILSGLLVMGTGILGVSLARSLPLALACAAFAGFGHGIIDVVMNVSISDLFPQKRASVLNLLNVFYGIGAFIAPAVAGYFLRLSNNSLPALQLGAGLELALIPLSVWLFRAPTFARSTAQSAQSSQSLLRSPALWLLGMLLLLYVGTENAAGGWVSTYLQQTTFLAAATAALGASGFWLALTIGRVVGTILGARWQARSLLAASLGVAFCGGLLISLSTGHVALSVLGFLLLGFGFGPVFPTTLAITTAAFSQSSGAAASLVVAMGSIGGMIIPWLQGILLENSGPRAGALLLPLGGLLMLGCTAAIRRARGKAGFSSSSFANISGGDKMD